MREVKQDYNCTCGKGDTQEQCEAKWKTYFEIFSDGKVGLDGYIIPHLDVNPCTNDDAFLSVTVDDRLGFFIPKEHAFDILALCANAMAVAAGFSSFGQHLRPINHPANAFNVSVDEARPAKPNLVGLTLHVHSDDQAQLEADYKALKSLE